MQQLYGTASLRHLAQRRRLEPWVRQLPKPRPRTIKLLRRLARSGAGMDARDIGAANASDLLALNLITTTAPRRDEARLPFLFVQAINLELTYGCNLACSHCLQAPLRPAGQGQWLPAALIQRRLSQAQALGLLDTGLNVTGGETVAAGSPLLEVLAMAQVLDIPTRANTNAWWGHQQRFIVGDHCFADDHALVSALQHYGLRRLALSLDDRYRQLPQLLERVIRVASLCEAIGLDYEFVATDADPALVNRVLHQLRDSKGAPLRHARITAMERVDVGAAQPSRLHPLDPEDLATLVRRSGCGGKGFHRPIYLHVTPNGGVRSCLDAPGAGWLGNLLQQSWIEILNAAAANPVSRLFEAGEIEAFVAEHLTPWRHLYRGLEHGCTAAALIARLAERLAQQQQALNRPLGPQELEPLHRHLAAEMSVSAATGAGPSPALHWDAQDNLP